MPRQVTVQHTSLRTCLVNLPLSLYGPLVEKGVAPQALVVELGWSFAGKPSKAYVGWTGLASRLPNLAAARQQADTLEIDAQFARELGLRDGQQTNVNLKLSVPQAQTLNIAPLSADDWEVMELHAEEVEQTMLGQVRSATQGQHVCIWAGKSKTFMRFMVESTVPDEVVRLGPETEVIVAPKTRQKATALQELDTTQEREISFTNRLFRLLPAELGSLCSLSLDQNDSHSRIAAVPHNLYGDLIRAFPSGTCGMAIQPFRKRQPTTRHAGKSQPSASENDEPAVKRKEKTSKGKSVMFLDGGDMPEGHVWLNPVARSALGLQDGPTSLEGFEMLRFAVLTASVADRSKSATNGLMPSLPEINTPLSSPSLAGEQFDSISARMAKLTMNDNVLAGVDEQIAECVNHTRSALKSWKKGTPTCGLTVRGSLGTGKTSLVKAVARRIAVDPECLAYVNLIDCSKFVDERPTVLKDKIKEWFDEACWRSPSVLLFDNLDRMVPAEVEHIDPFRSMHIGNLFASAAASACADRPIVCVFTSSTSPGLHAVIQSSHLADQAVVLNAPSKASRKEIIASLIGKKTAGSLLQPSVDFAAVSAMTDGYLPADLRDLVDRAIHNALTRRDSGKPLELTEDNFTAAQKDFTPISLQSIKLQHSDTRWADIGGLRDTRRVLRETLEWPTKYARIFANCPLRLRSGLLLYGYPGCGKTLLASAAARECGLNFISVKGPELLNKYIGASEKSVRDLFDRAQAARPCVLFFDEFDSIAPKRGHDSTGVTDRVVNQLLTQMDGAEGLEGVYVLAATSRPDLIDPALLRPGRLDKSLLCDMPDSRDRKEILEACSRKIQFEDDIDLSDYAERTEGYTGADLQALTYNANLEAIHDVMKISTDQIATRSMDEAVQLNYTTLMPGSNGAQKGKSQAEKDEVVGRLERLVKGSASNAGSAGGIASKPTQKTAVLVSEGHLERAYSSMRPSMPPSELKRLRGIYDAFVSKRSTNGLPQNEPSNGVGARSSLM